MSKHMYATANLTDVELKDEGNRLFSGRKFEDAISCYTKAIVSRQLFNFFEGLCSNVNDVYYKLIAIH